MSNMTRSLMFGGGTGVTNATAAEVAALALAGELTPGAEYFDAATGIKYFATSASTYTAYAVSSHLGELAFAVGIATPDVVEGMTFDASDVGNQRPRMVSRSGVFVPVGGLMNHLRADIVYTAPSTADAQITGASVLFPKKLLGVDGVGFTIKAAGAKAGTTSVSTLSLRFGPNNNATDPIIAVAWPTGTARQWSISQQYRRVSNLLLQRQGANSSAAVGYDGFDGLVNGTIYPNASVSDLDTVDQYLSLSYATDTIAEPYTLNTFDIALAY